MLAKILSNGTEKGGLRVATALVMADGLLDCFGGDSWTSGASFYKNVHDLYIPRCTDAQR